MTQWQGENDFSLFKTCVPISSPEVWLSFYQLHSNVVQVKKEKIAVEKLKIIITATFKLSNQKGFSLMSLRDLCQETGMSMGSLYAYIGSKGQLAEMIHQFLPYIFDLCMGNQLEQNESNWLKLEKIIRGHLFITECLQSWFFFAFMETKHLNRSVKQFAKNSEEKSEFILRNIIEEGVNAGEFTTTDSFLTSMMIKGLLQNWYVKHIKYKNTQTSCETYIDFIENVIKRQLGITA